MFDSVEDAITFTRERIASNCDYELQVIGDDGNVLYTRRQQPCAALAGLGGAE